MKKLFLSTIIILITTELSATDRIVQQNGPIGTYGSIGEAVVAAVDGDRIMINNRTDFLPWQEDITINKSLTFTSAVDGQKIFVNGKYEIIQSNGRKVDILNMNNISTGVNITVSDAVGVLTNRTKITVLNSQLSGAVDVSPTVINNTSQIPGVNLYLGSNIIDGEVRFSYGKLMGNKINNRIIIWGDLETNNDSIWMVGNDITPPLSITSQNTIYNNTQYIMCYNNFFKGYDGLTILTLKQGVNNHLFVNNSFQSMYTYRFGINIGSSVSSNFYFINNSIDDGVYVSETLSVQFLYNAHESQSGATSLSNALGNLSATIGFNVDRSNNFTQGTNTGHPSNDYLDLDLTRNDMGCYGGSYSFANFHPINNGKSSRVSFFKVPRVVNQGNTFNIVGEGFDK